MLIHGYLWDFRPQIEDNLIVARKEVYLTLPYRKLEIETPVPNFAVQ